MAHSSPLPSFGARPFCRICCTQLPPDLRGRIARKAQKKGAEYTPDLRKDYNTHLIAMWAEGRKYEFATRWKMKIVHPRWFYDCLTHGEFLNEEQYPVTPHQPGVQPHAFPGNAGDLALHGGAEQLDMYGGLPEDIHLQPEDQPLVMMMPPPGEPQPAPVAYNGDETHEDAPEEEPDPEADMAVFENDDEEAQEGQQQQQQLDDELDETGAERFADNDCDRALWRDLSISTDLAEPAAEEEAGYHPDRSPRNPDSPTNGLPVRGDTSKEQEGNDQ